MIKSLGVPEMMSLFREALLALIPIADRADIQWKDDYKYDPWENIEQTLFKSILTSTVENSTPVLFKQLAAYGRTYRSLLEYSFISESNARLRGETWALIELESKNEAFDKACFARLDSSFNLCDDYYARVPFSDASFELAARTESDMRFLDRVTYID